MSLSKRIAVLEQVRCVAIKDAGAASDGELARFLGRLSPEELRGELVDWPTSDFESVLGCIREFIPHYGASI